MSDIRKVKVPWKKVRGNAIVIQEREATPGSTNWEFLVCEEGDLGFDWDLKTTFISFPTVEELIEFLRDYFREPTRKKGSTNMATKHPGFDKVSESMARKQGVSKETAAKELAASSRNASASAKRANPRLSRVRGK